jgi:hypothetical protein
MGCDIKPVERCDTAAEGAALGLLGLMSGISEEYWYASWLRGLEFDLWNVAANTKYGHGTITERQAALLRLLSDECDGWWHWTNSEADSPEFVSLDEWRAILKQGPESYRPSIP